MAAIVLGVLASSFSGSVSAGCIPHEQAKSAMIRASDAAERVAEDLPAFMANRASRSTAQAAVTQFEQAAVEFYQLLIGHGVDAGQCDSLPAAATEQVEALQVKSTEVRAAISAYPADDAILKNRQTNVMAMYPLAIGALGGVFFKALNQGCICDS